MLIVVAALTTFPDSVPENVLFPAMVWAVVRSTKFCVAEPVPPFATGTTPSRALLSVPDEIFEALRFVRPEPLPDVCKYWFAAIPPSCVAFVAVFAVSAVAADRLLTAYGELPSFCRGSRTTKPLPPAFRSRISRKRSVPSKTTPKSSLTVKMPLLTATPDRVASVPICVPLATSSNKRNSKS